MVIAFRTLDRIDHIKLVMSLVNDMDQTHPEYLKLIFHMGKQFKSRFPSLNVLDVFAQELSENQQSFLRALWLRCLSDDDLAANFTLAYFLAV
jgi:hypothetical protein